MGDYRSVGIGGGVERDGGFGVVGGAAEADEIDTDQSVDPGQTEVVAEEDGEASEDDDEAGDCEGGDGFAEDERAADGGDDGDDVDYWRTADPLDSGGLA